jgi:hypothetical protein
MKMMSNIRRHILSICLTAASILLAWTIITLPMLGVFFIDDEFAISEYVRFVLYAAGTSLAISAIVMFPLALLAERFAARAKVLIVLIPLCLLAVSGVCLLGRLLLTGALLDTVLGWTGGLVAFSLVFTVYWSSLWSERAVIYGFRKLIVRLAGSVRG